MKKRTLNRAVCLAASILLIFHMIPLQVFAAEQPKTETEGIELKAESKPDAEEIFTGEKTLLRTSVIQGNGEYLYKYCRQEISDDSEEEVSDGQASMEQPAEEDVDFNETVLQEYSTQDYYEIQEDSAGEYTYYTYVKDSSGQTVKIESTILVKEADEGQEVPESTIAESEDKPSQEAVSGQDGVQPESGSDEDSEEKSAGEQIPVQDNSAGQPGAADSLEEAEPEQPVRETGLQGTLAGSRGAQSYENRGVVLTADVKGGDGKYTYRFRHSYNGKTETVQDYGSSAEYRFTASGIGTHIYYADVQDGAGRKLTLNFTMKVTAEPVVKLQGTLTGSRGSQSYENRGVVLTAAVTQGSGGYTYRFRHSYNGKTETVQDYGSSAEYRFTTSGIGSHTYYVDIRDWKGQVLSLSFAMKVTAEPVAELQGTLTGSRGTSAYVNRGVTLTAAVTQGNGGYEYRFRESYNGASKILQNYGAKSTYVFTTSGVGTHAYYVDVRDAKGKTCTLRYDIRVTVEPGAVMTGTVTGSRGNQVYVNRGVVLTAKAGNTGYGDIVYRFVDFYEGQETVVQDYSSRSVYSFTSSRVGTHTYYVDMKDKQNQVVRIAYQLKVTSEPGYALKAELTGSRTGNVFMNRGVTLTASAHSGYGEYQYQFAQEYNGYRRVVREYSADNTYAFTTGMAGAYTYIVTIRDKHGAKASASWKLTVVSDGSQTYGIDVSKWNGDVNWKQVRDQGVQFAMIRCSSDQGNKDSKFEQNYAGAKAQGLRVGVYHYSYATTVEEARKEAQFVIKTLNDRNLDLPVAFDIEDPGAHYPLTKSQATAVTKAFCEEIKKAGYVPMIYSMQSFFTTHLDYSQLSSYKMWVARWKADSPGVSFPVDMWQFSSQGNVPGANTSTGCDVNYAFGL